MKKAITVFIVGVMILALCLAGCAPRSAGRIQEFYDDAVKNSGAVAGTIEAASGKLYDAAAASFANVRNVGTNADMDIPLFAVFLASADLGADTAQAYYAGIQDFVEQNGLLEDEDSCWMFEMMHQEENSYTGVQGLDFLIKDHQLYVSNSFVDTAGYSTEDWTNPVINEETKGIWQDAFEACTFLSGHAVPDEEFNALVSAHFS